MEHKHVTLENRLWALVFGTMSAASLVGVAVGATHHIFTFMVTAIVAVVLWKVKE